MLKVAVILCLIILAVGGAGVSQGADVCSLPQDKGPCRALIPRWAYNPSEKKCVQFNYGGCRGNANNFQTEEACNEACPGS